MTAVAAMARVQELQTMMLRSHGVQGPPNTGAAQPMSQTNAAGATAFANALQSAQTTTPTTATPSVAATPAAGSSETAYDGLIAQSAQRNGVPANLLKALISQESNFNPNAGSGAGARGLTQLMPGTAASLGVTDVTDPAQSIEGGAKYLAQQLKHFNGDQSLALAAYNAGPGAVERYDGIPPYAETQNYVRSVLAKAQGYAA